MVKSPPAVPLDLCPSPELLAATLLASNQPLLWFDRNNSLVAVSNSFRHSYGDLCPLYVGMSLAELLAPADPAALSQLRSPLPRSAPHHGYRLHLANGQTRAVVISPRLLGDGQTLALLVADLDHATEEEAIRGLQRDVLEGLATGTSLTALLELLCQQVEALAPEVICSVLRIDDGRLRPVAAPSVPAVFSAAIDGLAIGPAVGSCGTAAWRGEAVMVTDIASDPLWADYRGLALPLGLAACWSSPIAARDGRIVGTFAFYYRQPRAPSDFHMRMVDACVHLCSLAMEHEEAEQRINNLAYYDSLTGLANRTRLRERGLALVAEAQSGHQPLALLFLDVDRFKTVNDSLGHPVGDRILIEVASRLRRVLGEQELIARLGGDEFVVVLPQCDGGRAAALATTLLQALTERIELDRLILSPTLSIGISLCPDDGRDFDTLLKHADIAMYRAKEDGRACFRFFLQEMNDIASRRLELESALRQALSSGQLQLHYQPQLWLDGRCLYGVEALVRWHHPQWGAMSPALFIPLAEECGLINALDGWVLEAACAQLQQWDRAGIAIPAVAVNVSAARFVHDDLPGHVATLLKRYGLAAGRLTLEITERLMMADVDRSRQALAELHAMGVRLAVDDFGTGYSSLSYLKRFPVSEIKLDQSFVRELESDIDDRALAIAVIGIGRSLNQVVVAEGVETAWQLDYLRSQGCDVAQGYHLGRPLAATALVQWLANDGPRWGAVSQPG